MINWINSVYNTPMIGYVLNSDNYKTIESNNISINVTTPNEGNKFANFFIKPSFVDRLVFTSNKDISDTLNINLTNSGILPDKVSHINKYPKNITGNINAVTKKVLKNFTFVNKNIISNSWVNNMFNNKIYVNNTTNLKSFFGSCCINIPNDSLTINISNNITAEHLSLTNNTSSLNSTINVNALTNTIKTYTYKVNLTDAFVNYILGLPSFNSNWSLLT
jgi:hypothetical protein